jgi:Uma2 family endonuclease
MSIAEPQTIHETVRTFADLLADLGDIPAARILMHPAPGTATGDDVVAAAEAPVRRQCELIDGVLVEKAMGVRESFLAAAILDLLRDFIIPRNLGLVAGADGTIHLSAGRNRIPDVAFFSWDRLPGRRMPEEPIPDVSPDLAVEVVSVSNTLAELERKRSDYFRSGVQIVWQVDPRARTVAVYTGPDNPTTLRSADVLDGGTVLPGFTLPLPDLFGKLDRHG